MTELTENTYKKTIKKATESIVVFTREKNCIYCDEFKKVCQQIETDTDKTIFYVLADSDYGLTLCKNYGIEYVPTTLVFKNNEIIKRMDGGSDYNYFLHFLEGDGE